MHSEGVYIAVLGRSSWALLNCYYAVLRETPFRPVEILVITEQRFASRLSAVKEGLTILSSAYGLVPRVEDLVIEEANFQDACRRIPEAIQQRKREGKTIALDITSGRKALIAGALLGVPRDALDHVFYLALARLEDAVKPYLMIPLPIQSLKDFKAATTPCEERAP